MSDHDAIRVRLNKVLGELAPDGGTTADDDGDVTLTWEGVLLYLRLIEDEDPPLVRVSCPILLGVARTPALLEAINGVNAGIRFGRMYWLDDQVVVSTEMVAATLDREELESACRAVAEVVRHLEPTGLFADVTSR